MHYVYTIETDGIVRYIGRTNNPKRREYQHNYNLKKGKSSQFYDFCYENNINEVSLKVIREFSSKTEAKRYEMFLILIHHFEDNFDELFQKVPNISDR